MKKIIFLSIASTLVFSPKSFAVKKNQTDKYLELEEKQPLGPTNNSQKQKTKSSIHDLIKWKIAVEGRVDGHSPHGDHYGDLINGMAFQKKKRSTRGTTFYCPSTSNRLPSAKNQIENRDSDSEVRGKANIPNE